MLLVRAPTGVKNDQVTIAKDSSGNISLTNANSATISLDNSDVGLGNVDNDSTADIRSGTTKANVGLGMLMTQLLVLFVLVLLKQMQDQEMLMINHLLLFKATLLQLQHQLMQDQEMLITTLTADIRSGTTKANVGLGNVDDLAASAIRAGTTKANVGLGKR